MKCNHCGAEMDFEDLITRSSLGREVKWVCPNCSNVQYQLLQDALEGNTRQSTQAVKDEWFNFRCQAAKDFVASILCNPNPTCGNISDKNIAIAAIKMADELIKQLKECNEHNNSK